MTAHRSRKAEEIATILISVYLGGGFLMLKIGTSIITAISSAKGFMEIKRGS
jgi:hypothetical protein